MADSDDDNQIVSGPPPRRGPTLADLRAAARALLRPRPAPPPDADHKVEPARRSRPAPDFSKPATLTREQVQSGAPAFILAPAYLLFAAVCVLPQVARMAAPEAPRAFIARAVAALPDWAAPMESVWNGWLWAPWWILAPALLMRLNSVRITVTASLDAVGWSMAALLVQTAAWLFYGRGFLARDGVSVAERDGAWQLLLAEFVFLFLVATWFSPNTGGRTRFEQG